MLKYLSRYFYYWYRGSGQLFGFLSGYCTKPHSYWKCITAHKIEALTLKEGIKIKGEGAHQELIDYIAKQQYIDEQTKQFLQKMRDYRNRISYEGFMIHRNYINLNNDKIRSIIKNLFERLKITKNSLFLALKRQVFYASFLGLKIVRLMSEIGDF